jgi:hypothetical protein
LAIVRESHLVGDIELIACGGQRGEIDLRVAVLDLRTEWSSNSEATFMGVGENFETSPKVLKKL